MHLISVAFALQFAVLHSVRANDDDPLQLATRVTIWSKEGCEKNLGDGDVLTHDFDIYESHVGTKDPKDEDLACRVMSWNHPDWPTDKDDSYKAWLDTSGIDEGCKLLLYELDKEADETTPRNCVGTYDSLSNKNTCVGLNVPKKMGYSYCCGKACGLQSPDDVFVTSTKRDFNPAELRPVNEAFPDAGTKRSAPDAVPDVAAPKRAPPFNILNERSDDHDKRDKDECRFEGDKEAKERRMGEQLRITPKRSCSPSSSSGCPIEYTYSYSEMVGESFGVGASMGFSLFEIMSASVEFSQTFEESEETTRQVSSSYEVDPGFSGYLVWEPTLLCAKGKLVGDKCDDEYTLEKEDEACFVKMMGGNPDGIIKEIREN